MKKLCRTCKKIKLLNQFYVHKRDHFSSRCIKCTLIYNRKYYKNNTEKVLRTLKLWGKKNHEKRQEIITRCRRKLRQEMISKYGGKCICCGEDNIIFLAMDHKNDDGVQERKKFNLRSSAEFYYFIKKQGFPKKYQILCYNCNWAKARGGCPHQYGTTKTKI